MSKSLQARMTYLFAAFVLLVVVSVAAMMWGSETQRQDAVLINLAGRQRMLAQQMARLAVEVDGTAAVDRTLLEAEQIFDQTQAALREGGVAPYLSDLPVTLPAARDAGILTALHQVDLAWGDFRALVGESPQSLRGNSSLTATRQFIEASASTLVERADLVVRLYEASATAKVNRLRAVQLGFLAGALLLLATGAWVTRQSVLAPLQGLKQAATRLGENDLDSVVHIEGPSELQALSESFDVMRQNLRASRSELLDLMTTLEARVAQRTRELNALNEVSREIASQLDVRQVLTSVTAKAATLLSGDAAMLCLLDEAGHYLQLEAASGVAIAATNTEPASSVDLAAEVLSSRRALVCSHGRCIGGCNLLTNAQAASHVVAPLRIGENVIGALCVSSSRPNHFADEEAEVVTKLANTAAVALQNAQLYAQAERAAALEERNRIAADMHDGLGQTLSYLGLVTDQTVDLLADGQGEAALAQLERIRQTIEQGTRQVRQTIEHLLDRPRSTPELSDLVQQTACEVAEKYGAQVQCRGERDAGQLSRQAAEQIINITREATENACRHAHAQVIRVHSGRENGHGYVRIEDDGCGFDPAAPGAEPRGHFGLQVMKARAAHIGGKCLIESAPGAGTRVTLTFPREVVKG